MNLLDDINNYINNGVGDSTEIQTRIRQLSATEKNVIDLSIRTEVKQLLMQQNNLTGHLPLNDQKTLTDFSKTVILSTAGAYFCTGFISSSSLVKLIVSASSCLFFGTRKAYAISNTLVAEEQQKIIQKLKRICALIPNNPSVQPPSTLITNSHDPTLRNRFK